MRTIEKRITKAEVIARHRASDLSLLTDAELERRADAFLVQMGLTREKVIAEFGSLGAFANVLRVRGDQHGTA